jgi:tRNA/tmRNA/rRNA uracil-C5-methylase (TrmA/RlmC/RlmD family)
VVRQGPDGDVVVGLFTQGTHRAVDIPLCQAHHPLINAAADLIRQCIIDCNVSCYDEGTGEGELRYVQLQTTGWSPQSLPTSRPLGRTRPWSDTNDDVSQQVIASAEGEDTALRVQVVLVWNAIDYESVADHEPLNRFVGQLWEAGHQPYATSLNTGASCPPLVHSIHVNFQPSRNNVILGPCTMLIRGSSDAWTYVGGVPIAFDPGSFLQVNPRAMSAVIDTMRRWVPRGARLVDLHAGVGTIGAALAATNRLQSLTLVEINPAGQQAFWKTWKALATVKNGIAIEDEGIEDGDARLLTEVEYHVAAAESTPGRWLANADVVVVDPPRKGLEPSLLEYLCREGDVHVAPQPKILIYLSCGWPAFERDCTSLVHSGRWKLEFAEGFIFFPGADHIETLAVFGRKMKPERRRRNASRKHAKHRK